MLDEDGDGEEAQQTDPKEAEPETAEEPELDPEDDEVKKKGEMMKYCALVFSL